jgi:hypothetical protein
MVSGIKNFLDGSLGPPGEALKNLKELTQALASIDIAKLRLLYALINSVDKIKGTPEELQTFVQIVTLLSAFSVEQLNALNDIIVNLTKLLRLLPREQLKNIPAGDLAKVVASIAEEFKKD